MTQLFVILLAIWASLQPQPLHTVELNTKPFPCDGVNRVERVSGPLRIRKVYVWTGLDMGARADLVFHLVRARKEETSGDSFMTLGKGGVDRYAEPTSLAGQTLWFDYTPDVFTVGKDEEVRLYVQCNNWAKPTRGHVIAELYALGGD